MKAKEFIPATKPRNFVAKNQQTAGAGAHKDKKRAEKQGDVKHKRDLMPMEAGWKDEADDLSEWTDYVKERLTKASPEQRLGLAKKLSQIEVKNFGSTLGGGFDRNTGKAKAGELTDTVRSALRSISAGRSSDGDGPAGNFSMPFGSVDIPGMENATPEELAVMKKAVMMGPQVAGAAAKLYKKNGTITSQDLKDIESGFEKASGIEFGKPVYSSPEAKASREKAVAGEGITEGSAHGYNVVRWYRKNRNSSKITAWLKKEAGLPKETKLYFDDADLVLGSDTIVPEALVDDTLKFNDLLTALVKVTGGSSKEKVDGVYRSQGVEEATGNDFRVGQRVIYKNSQGQQFPSIVTAVDFDEDAVKIKSADNKPFPNSGGDIEIVVDPGYRFLTPEPRVDPNSIIAVSPTMRKTTERVRDPEDWDEGNTEPGNNFAVYINGKKWKVFPGPAGAYADSPEERREFARLKSMAQRKSQESGKKWEVYITGEPATR